MRGAHKNDIMCLQLFKAMKTLFCHFSVLVLFHTCQNPRAMDLFLLFFFSVIKKDCFHY